MYFCHNVGCSANQGYLDLYKYWGKKVLLTCFIHNVYVNKALVVLNGLSNAKKDFVFHV